MDANIEDDGDNDNLGHDEIEGLLKEKSEESHLPKKKIKIKIDKTPNVIWFDGYITEENLHCLFPF